MKNTKKGQVATEYLILLAIVLIVSVTVVSAFIDFSKISNSFGAKALENFWTNAEIAITAHTFYSNGEAVFMIRNNKGYAINLQKIIIDKEEINIDQSFYAGKEKTIKVQIPTNNEGSYYSKKISFKYTELGNNKEFNYAPNVKLTGHYE